MKFLFPIFIISAISLGFGIAPVAFAQQQSNDWNLSVYIQSTNFGAKQINLDVYGAFGAHQSIVLANGQDPSCIFSLSGSDFPTGYYYKVCASDSLVGLLANLSRIYTWKWG